MDAETLKTLKEVIANSFKKNLIDFFQTTLPLLPQLCEGITVTTPAAAKLFNKVPQFRLDPGLLKLVFPTYDKIAREMDVILKQQALGFQSEIDQLINKGKAKMSNEHADLPDLEMNVNHSHQSTLSIADTLPPPSDTTTTS
ncbi:hypothetical protein RclHR1_00830027 [Rhizophagus clarus]|uniref:Uncharacterized protein n=1 Tax=Rhizophagus clarus TaxID=94130 RepID=A0A2Z6S0H7_9GLOM|nr:hypothetical protein RclHR1_00830027 [Rhizophagus clarus]GES90779.1 hypothetical protein RCL_jg14351.t1 [Rhizophagus clarus]